MPPGATRHPSKGRKQGRGHRRSSRRDRAPAEASSDDATLPPTDAESDAAPAALDAETGADANASNKDAATPADAALADAALDADAEAADAADAAIDAGAPDATSDAEVIDASKDAAPDSGPDAGACDPVAQTGCPPADKCTIDPPTCVPNGTVANGGKCGPADDCSAGNLCADDGTNSICRELCAVDTDCKQAPVSSGSTAEPNNVARCTIDITGTTSKVCTFACNPVSKAGASGCLTGMACTWETETGGPELTDCETVGTAVEGATCTYTSDCASGLACIDNGTSSHCRDVCRNATPADCTVAGDVCYAPSGVTSPMFGICCPSGGC